MNKIALTGLLLTSLTTGTALYAQENLSQPEAADTMVFERAHPTIDPETKVIYPPLTLKVTGIQDGKRIPEKFAYCIPDGKGKTKDGQNISPAISWLGAPEQTKSYAFIIVDEDVPADFTDANKDGKELPVKAPRQDFYHWALVNIPPNSLGILEGADSKGITPGGKPVGHHAYGTDGRNDYAMMGAGEHGGYDGPCPPWNDLRLHHYHFRLYALDIANVGLHNPITAQQALSVMKGHILAAGQVTGIFSNNPRWLQQFKNESQKEEEMIPYQKFNEHAQ